MDIFKEGKFELLTLMEMKLKGKEKVSWYGVNGIITSVQEMERAREGLAILLNNVWHNAVLDIACVSPRILWIKFKFSRIKVYVVVGYGSNEEDGKERNGQDSGLSREWIKILHSGSSEQMDSK